MRDRLDDFGDCAVAVVTFATADRLAAHRVHLGLSFPVLADPDRSQYRRFGFERGTRRQVWNPGTLALYARLLRKGRRPGRSGQDLRQLGGDVILDPHGRLASVFRPLSPDARPTIDQLVAAVADSRAKTS